MVTEFLNNDGWKATTIDKKNIKLVCSNSSIKNTWTFFNIVVNEFSKATLDQYLTPNGKKSISLHFNIDDESNMIRLMDFCYRNDIPIDIRRSK